MGSAESAGHADDAACCVVCHRREPHRGQVCETDRERIAAALADLPRKLAALTLRLVRGPSAGGDKVHTSHAGSPTPANVGPLSLLGPGAEWVSEDLQPAVRRWRTYQEVLVHVVDPATGDTVLQPRTVALWERELVTGPDGQPAMVPLGDQVGALPPAQWLDTQVRAWRLRFGHTVPARTRPALELDKRRRAAHAQARQAFLAAAALPQTRPAAAAVAAIHAQARAHRARTVLGLHGYREPGDRPADPLAEEWAVRYGRSVVAAGVADDVTYLLDALPRACDDPDAGLAEFAAELRAITAELTHVLGEEAVQEWLGRCPVQLTDRATGEQAPCGAHLWQDPYVDWVRCPRCRTEWPFTITALLDLSADIRRVWPLDRRRRYHADDIDALTPPPCPACRTPVQVSWREVTERADTRRWWRPDQVTCPHGCAAAARVGGPA